MLGFTDEAEQLDAALAAFESNRGAHVAVLSEPWSGRERLLDYAEAKVEVTTRRVQIPPTSEERLTFDWSAADVFLISDCQHLYRQQIGGFEILDDFLRAVAGFDGMVISSRNVFAWRYLQAVKQLNRVFTTQIKVAKLEREEIAALLTSESDGELPKYVASEGSKQDSLVERIDYSFEPWGNREIVVPLPRFNREAIRRQVAASGGSDPEQQAFDKITRLANGNPGVARRIWEESIDDGIVEVDSIREPTAKFEFDYDTEFLLQEILTKERITVGELAEVVEHPDTKRALGSLARDNVLTVADDTVELAPKVVSPVIEERSATHLRPSSQG